MITSTTDKRHRQDTSIAQVKKQKKNCKLGEVSNLMPHISSSLFSDIPLAREIFPDQTKTITSSQNDAVQRSVTPIFQVGSETPPRSPGSSARSSYPTSCQSVQQDREERQKTALKETRKHKQYFHNDSPIFPDFTTSSEGRNSTIYAVLDENLVIKMNQTSSIISSDSLIQHDDLFSRQTILSTNPLDENFYVPIIPILNRNSCTKDGYILQEKIRPFTQAPWSPDQSLISIQENPITASYLDQMTNLFIHTLFSEKPALDLRWTNFGIKPDATSSKDTIYLFDFYEQEDQFYLFADESLLLIADGNQEVLDYILEQCQIAVPRYDISNLKEKALKRFIPGQRVI